MIGTTTIIDFLLENEDEDEADWKELVRPDSLEMTDAWLARYMPRYGFHYQQMGIKGWEKEKGGKSVSVSASTTPGHALVSLYRKTGFGRWQPAWHKKFQCGQRLTNELSKLGFIP